MNYIRLYFTTHFQHWRMYLISLLVSLFGVILSLFLAFFLGSLGMSNTASFIICMFVGSLINSSPIIYVNYKIAVSYLMRRNQRRIIFLTICNHLVTFFVYFMIYASLLIDWDRVL